VFVLACVAASIPHFVSVEVISLIETLSRLRSIAAVWRWASIAVLNVEMVIYVAVKAVRSVEPWAGADEDSTRKPFRAVVTVGSTSIGSVVIVAVGTCRRDSDVDAYPGLCFGSGYRETNHGNSSECKTFNFVHTSSSMMAIACLFSFFLKR
jgi:hypothetical protein